MYSSSRRVDCTSAWLYVFQTLYANAFGQRDIAQSLPTTNSTVFSIGSCTKAFTSMLVAIAVDQGLVAWSDPVAKHIPGFA